jgi:ABC-2 type transport system permease protein
MRDRPAYLRVFWTFARNSLVRDMTFRGDFLISTISSMTWVFMNLGFYILIFHYTPMLGQGTGWGKYQFFLFLSTTLLINSVVHAFFMRNADEFGELIRTGNLDFALLKPIDTQFLVSLGRIEWSALGNFALGVLLMVYSLWQVDYLPSVPQMVLYPVYLCCGVAILYSLMIGMAASSVWLGRNQSLFSFWFYITNFSRYPMEIYRGTFGTPLRLFFTFIVPVLVVVNVPARLLVRPLEPNSPEDWLLPFFAVFAGIASLATSRWLFNRALLSYRSASS